MALTEETQAAESRQENVGRIESIQGVVIDAVFLDHLPEINHAILIKRPRLEETNWIVPLGIQGDEADLGQVVLDRDGNVIEELSSSRGDLLARIHG